MRVDRAIFLVSERLLRGFRRHLRTFYYSRILKSMGKGCQICDDVHIYGPENISMGNQVIVNEGVILQSCDGAAITIGNRVGFSYGACVLTGGLEFANGVNLRKHISAPVIIKDGVWIGAKAIILPGVTIGTGTVVAAGSVVTRSIPCNVIVAGVPGKTIKTAHKASS